MSSPLNLAILRTVEQFGRVPLSFLISRVSASPGEVERQVQVLANQGAVTVEEGHVKIRDTR